MSCFSVKGNFNSDLYLKIGYKFRCEIDSAKRFIPNHSRFFPLSKTVSHYHGSCEPLVGGTMDQKQW